MNHTPHTIQREAMRKQMVFDAEMMKKRCAELTDTRVEYEKTVSTLEMLIENENGAGESPKEKEVKWMVPFGDVATMPGKLVNNGRVLCVLGDGWFAEKTHIEAIEFLKRRVTELDHEHSALDARQKEQNESIRVMDALIAVEMAGGAGLGKDFVEITETLEESVEHGRRKGKGKGEASPSPSIDHEAAQRVGRELLKSFDVLMSEEEEEEEERKVEKKRRVQFEVTESVEKEEKSTESVVMSSSAVNDVVIERSEGTGEGDEPHTPSPTPTPSVQPHHVKVSRFKAMRMQGKGKG